jgi:hypothetical protein
MRVDPGHRVIERRTFLGVIAGGLLAAPLTAEAQQAGRKYRIGFLFEGTPPDQTSPLLEALEETLRQLGYAEGRNLAFEPRYAAFKYDRLPELAAELVRLHITRFQITYYEWTELEKYQRRLQQHVLTYDRNTGLKAAYVPDESSAFPTPKVLVPEDCRECCKRLALEIANDSSGIPDYVAQFIVKTLETDEMPCP